jgi:hypothetical protein
MLQSEYFMFKKIVESPYLTLLSGIVLLLTSLYDIYNEEQLQIGIEHGILVYSLINIISVIPEIIRGAKEIEEAEIVIKAEKSSNIS